MKTIIFVCHGSICRSPACEYIAKSLSQEHRFISRAISHEEIGNDIYPPMKEALAKAGIPYGKHHAAYLSKADLQEADAVFYMDESNKRRLFYVYPEFASKMKPVFCYTPGITEIEDPWYTDRFDLVVEQLQHCVKDILSHLDKE